MEGRSSGKAAPDEVVGDADARGVLQEQARAAKLTETQKAERELREELQKARDDYNMATGTMGKASRKRTVILATSFIFLPCCSFYLEKFLGYVPVSTKPAFDCCSQSGAEMPLTLKPLSLPP